MTDTIIGAYIAVGGAILGAIIAGPIAYFFSKQLISRTHKNAVELMTRQEFNKAATLFINAFQPELFYVRDNINILKDKAFNNIGECLLSARFRHFKAVQTFKNYLCAQRRREIEEAWQEYCGNDKHLNFRDYFYTSTERETQGEIVRQLALTRIEKLLKFADFK